MRGQCNALVGQFKELLLESHAVQNEVRGKLKDKIVRQVKVLDSDISQEKAEEIAENPKVKMKSIFWLFIEDRRFKNLLWEGHLVSRI